MRHAKLAPSASHRWINCTGSIDACEGLPEDPANMEAACYGTGAHVFSEKLLRAGKDHVDEKHLGETFRYRFNESPAELTIDADFITHVNVYLDRIMSLSRLGGKLTLEQAVRLDFIRPGMFGHMDALIDQGRRIVVADLKFGFVPVFLIENPDALLFNAYDEGDINTQLLCYAAGALEMVQWLPDEVQLEIIQPRSFEVESVQSIIVPTSYVEEWVDDVAKPAAARVYEQPELKAGEWCRFCPAKIRPDGVMCSAFMEKNSAIVTADFSEFGVAPSLPDIEKISTAQLLDILRWSPVLDAFLRQANAFAFQLLMSGNKDLEGYYKLVRGRGTRYWPWASYEEGALELSAEVIREMQAAEPEMSASDTERIFKTQILKNITVPIVLRSPKQIEDLGGAYKRAVATLAKKRAGDLTLAKQSDRRNAVEPLTELEDMGLARLEESQSE